MTDKILIDRKVLEQALNALMKLAEHNQHCDVFNLDEENKHMPCTCGFVATATALREELAVPQPAQDSNCSEALRAQGKAYPRTCKKCGLGPCVTKTAPQPADQTSKEEVCGVCHGCGKTGEQMSQGGEVVCWRCDGSGVAPQPAPAQQPAMTAHRAAYFMDRFKREEKLLGPNEQAAVDFVIAMLAAPQPAQQPKGYVPVPLTDNEALMMVLLATNWLEHNAPHRLKQASQPAEQPLTQPEKQRLWNDAMHNNRSSTTDAAMDYGSSIEAAHGIGGEKP